MTGSNESNGYYVVKTAQDKFDREFHSPGVGVPESGWLGGDWRNSGILFALWMCYLADS